MNQYHVTTIALDDDHRIVVEYDTDAASPREWQDSVSVHPIYLSSRYLAPDAGTNSHETELSEILEHNLTTSWYGEGYVMDWAVEAPLRKHFERAGIPFLIADQSSDRDHVGTFIWYLEPAMVLENRTLDPDWDAMAYLEAVLDEYRKWASGEVYVLSLETRTRWVKPPADGVLDGDEEERFTWDTTDSVGAVYLDAYDDEAVMKYVRQDGLFGDLPIEVAEAAGLVVPADETVGDR